MTKDIKTLIVVGARPNFMKAAPILKAMKASGKFDAVLAHTGQHYDFLMSDVFFRDLDMPKPDIYLGIGSMERGQQIEAIKNALKPKLAETKRELVIVVGDVNSTIAAAEAAKELKIKVAHVEAGLRSGDNSMPEEINRIKTDKISDFLFTTEESANKNLKEEGAAGAVHFVGNAMIDSLYQNLPKIKKSEILRNLKLNPKGYAVLTLHRPANVDNRDSFLKIFSALIEIQKKIPIVFPVHPRTKKQIEEFGLKKEFSGAKNFVVIDPLGYLDFMKLVSDAKLILTDSGGLQEEASVLGIPCLTLRKTTERPVTVEIGTNIITGDNSGRIIKEAEKILAGKTKEPLTPQYWDGKAAERIVKILAENFK